MKTSSPPSDSAFSNGLAVLLAGGESRRFGRDKSNYPWKGRTFSAHIRQTARQAGLQVRVVRRDLVARCGPLGGIYTAFRRHRAPWILFLACDMPLVRPAYLARMAAVFEKTGSSLEALVTQIKGKPGFPLILAGSALPRIQAQISTRDVSLRSLFSSLRLKQLTPPSSELPHLVNINHQADLSLLGPRDQENGPGLSGAVRPGKFRA